MRVDIYTIGYRYNSVQYNTMFPTALRWVKQNIKQCQITNHTPYIALTGKLWGVFCEDSVENWPRYNGTVLYKVFLAGTKQLYEWCSPSVCPSVRLSASQNFLTMFPWSYHHEIVRSYHQWQKWRPCGRSRSEVKGQGHIGFLGHLSKLKVTRDKKSHLR